jgi:hypothetical protein
MVACVVGTTSAVGVKYFWEEREYTNVVLVCPRNGNENSDIFIHSSEVLLGHAGTLVWFNVIRIISVVDLGKPFSLVDFKSGYKSCCSGINQHIPK